MGQCIAVICYMTGCAQGIDKLSYKWDMRHLQRITGTNGGLRIGHYTENLTIDNCKFTNIKHRKASQIKKLCINNTPVDYIPKCYSNLEELNLSDVPLTSGIPNLQHLTSLSLCKCKPQAPIPPLPGLREVVISDCPVDYAFLSSLRHVHTLIYHGNNYLGDLSMLNFPSLTSLTVSGVSTLPSAPLLKFLSISYVNFDKAIPHTYPRLEEIWISGPATCVFSNMDLSLIKELTLWGTKDIATIPSLPELRRLSVVESTIKRLPLLPKLQEPSSRKSEFIESIVYIPGCGIYLDHVPRYYGRCHWKTLPYPFNEEMATILIQQWWHRHRCHHRHSIPAEGSASV